MPELTQAVIEEAIGPIEKFHHQCHAASLALVKSGVLPGKNWRVARGWSRGIGGQHSWAVQGDPYARSSRVVDITMWSYQRHIAKIYCPKNLYDHEPHGYGYLVPQVIERPSIPEVTDLPLERLSDETLEWLQMRYPNGIGMQDLNRLVNGPMLAWNSREFIGALSLSRYKQFVPIDIRGMLTDENPGGLYF